MYASWCDELRAWRRQRFGHALFIPVALTLTVASLVGADFPAALQVGFRFLAAWLAVLTLRLWDDLEDLPRDRKLHPDRVLTQVTNLRPIVLFVGAMYFVVAALLFLGGGSARVWMMLVIVLSLFYRQGALWEPGADFEILLKYPVLVVALGGTQWSVIALVFSAVAMDELFQQADRERWQVIAGTAALIGSAVSVLVQLGPSVGAMIIQSLLTIAMFVLCAQDLLSHPSAPIVPRGIRRAGLLGMTLLILLLCFGSKIEGTVYAC